MSWVDETSLNATNVSHLWKHVTPGPENTLQHEECPAYPLPARQPAKVSLEPHPHSAEQSSPELPASMRDCLKQDTVPSTELELYKADVINELLKHNAFVIWGLPPVNMF